MTGIYITGVIAFALALVVAQICKPLARRTGIVARPKADRWHRQVIPLLGGVSIAAAVFVSVALVPIHDRELLYLLGGSAAMFLLGLIDDVRALKPQSKFVAQVLIAGVLTSLGLQLRLTGLPPLDVVLTLFWLVGITNAFNLLDNMDGLAAGIAGITAGFRLVFFLNDGDMEAAQFAAAAVGACLGFLVHNFNPASIFMGDAGSLFLGFLVAGLSLAGTFPYSRSTVSVLLFPTLILLVPIFDTTLVTIARTLAGRPVSRGGADHTSHRLVGIGLSERGAVLLLYAVAMLCGGIAFHGYTQGLSSSIVFVVSLSLGLLLFGLYLGRVQVYPEDETRRPPDGTFVRLIDYLPFKRQVATVAIDSVLIVIAYYSAYRLRFEHTYLQNEPMFIASAPIVLVCQLVAFAGFRVYQGVWRYTSLPDLLRLLKAATTGTALAILLLLVLYRFEGYSRAVFVIDWLVLILLVGGSRLSLRVFDEVLRRDAHGLQRVLIYGAGEGGVAALREMRSNRGLGLLAVGFIDDNRWKQRTSIHGVPVFGGIDQLETLLDKHEIGQVVVASEKISAERLERLTASCEERDILLVRAGVTLGRLMDGRLMNG